MTVHYPQEHDVVQLRSINHNIRPDNDDANVSAETGPRATGARMIRQPSEGGAELRRVVVCDPLAGAFGQAR